jgi:Domain of unknown function (DUF4260)
MSDDAMPAVSGTPRLLLRLEGAALAAGALILYAFTSGSWLLFGLLVLAPDLSMLGYLAGPRIGALAYNAVHITVGPIALALIGLSLSSDPAIAIALIWLVHIGADRALGYGLKYADGFGATHLGRIGRV